MKMPMLLKLSAGTLCPSVALGSPIRAFMDGFTVATLLCLVVREGLEKLFSWTSMSFNTAKYRAMMLKKG